MFRNIRDHKVLRLQGMYIISFYNHLLYTIFPFLYF